MSSTQYMFPMGTTLVWLKKQVLTWKKIHVELIEEERMKELIKVVKMLDSPKRDAKTLAFIMKN